MQDLKSLIRPIKIESKANSERASLLEDILREVNSERRGTKYKPMTPKLLGIKLAHIPTKDLYFLISEANDYKRRHGSYSKYLFCSIKVKV